MEKFSEKLFYSGKTKKAAIIAAFTGAVCCIVLLLPPLQKLFIYSAYVSLPFAGLVVFLFVLCCLYAEHISRFLENSALINLLTIIVLIFLLGFTGVFSYVNGWRWLNSDHASEMVLGRLLAQENAFVSTGWHYSTEIRLIYQTIFTMPLFKLLGSYENWALIRSINIVLNSIVLIAAYFFMMKQFSIKTKWILITSLFLVLPLSYEYWDIITFGGYYTFFIAQVFCCIGLFVKLVNHKDTFKTVLFTFILFLLLLFALGMQTIRALLIIHVPLLISCIYMRKKNPDKKNTLLLLGVCSFIFGCAGFIFNGLLQLKFNFFSFNFMRIENPASYFQKLGFSLVTLLKFFGISEGMPVFSAHGFFSIAAIAAAFILFFNLFKFIGKYNSAAAQTAFNPGHFMPVFFTAVLSVNIFVFIVSEQVIVSRYFLPFMIFYIPLAALVFELCETRREKSYGSLKCTAIICGILLFILGKGCLSFLSLSVRDENSHRKAHIEYLLDNNLEFGFASYWNANIITELANGKVNMVNIDHTRSGSGRTLFRIVKWLVPDKFLDPLYHKGESFLLLTRSEWDMARNRMFSSAGLTPGYEDINFVIIRFPSAQAIHDELLE